MDQYIAKNMPWSDELKKLRNIVTTLDLKEHIKWGMPVYSHQNKNLIGFSATKNFVGIWFFQGALLKDKGQKLINAQQGKTQAMRQWRFKNIQEIEQNQKVIKAYIQESIDNLRHGLNIISSKKRPLNIPDILDSFFKSHDVVHKAFKKLSPYKQREYAEYISEAKRLSTKEKRIEKITPMILEGKGLNDKYKN